MMPIALGRSTLAGVVCCAAAGVAVAPAAAGDRPEPAVSRTATGDFDRDGRGDRAVIVRGADGRNRLLVQPGAKGRSPIVVHDFGVGPADLFVSTSRPGRYETACHKGSGPGAREGKPCARDYVVLSGDVVTFGQAEASEAVALWTGKGFEVVWISD